MLGELPLDLRGIAEQQEFGVGMSGQRYGSAGNENRCADIATHGVKRDSNPLRHERPGSLIVWGLEALAAASWESPWMSAIGGALLQRPGRAATIACPRRDTTS